MLYTTFLSDGDSSAYIAVRGLNGGRGPYADQTVEKEECINHFQKRLGTARIWRLCPKHCPATKRMVDFAIATAVSIFSVGYLESNLADSLGIESSSSMLKYLTKKDKGMNCPWMRKVRNKIRRELEYAAGGY